MNKTKRLISIIISLAMVMQVFIAVPFVMAENSVETITVNPDGTVTVNPSEDFLVELRSETNLLNSSNPDVEGNSLWEEYNYFTPSYQRSNSYEISANQAYSGNQSMLVKRNGSYMNEAHFPKYNSIKANKTLVFSAMVLGTEANREVCEEKPDAMAKMIVGTYATTYFNYLPADYYIADTPVMLSSMLDAPSSDSAEKVSQDMWQMVHAGAVIPSSYTSGRWWSSGGVVVEGTGAEVFIDDFYMGELVVAKVISTTPETIYTPLDRFKTVPLTACAVNQLGNSEYFGDDSTYTWEALSLPSGVTLDGDSLVISRIATPGEIKLNVTFNPTFEGADAQSDSQKAGRTAEVTLNLELDPNVSSEPVVENIVVSGEISDGNTLSVDYDYWQVEGKKDASIITWYRRLHENEEWTPVKSGKKDTAGTYDVTADDEKYFFRVGVKPYTDSDPALYGEEIFTDEMRKATAPEASDVTVEGLQAIGEEWTAAYTYYDINGDEKDTAKYQWYRASSEDGEFVAIGGATLDSYTLKDEDKDMYIRVGVIAVSKVKPYFDEEKEAFSEPRLAAASPVINNLKVKNISNSMLGVSYEYNHPFGIEEGETVIEWYLGEELIGSGSSFLASMYNGETITVKVTPYAVKKPFEGKTEAVNYTVSIDESADEGAAEIDYSEKFLVSLREETNLLKSDNPDVEGSELWGTTSYFTPNDSSNKHRSQTYEISKNQAFSGKQSMLVKRPGSGTFMNESHFPKYTSILKDKTLVFSAMVLGTEANKSACNTTPGAKASIRGGTFYSGGGYFNILPEEHIIGSKTVLMNSMLDAPASDRDEKASKDKWKLVHSGAVIPTSYTANRYYSAGGVIIDGNGMELFVDDYYMGELVVAKVYNTTPERIYIPSEKFKKVPLTAFAVNQLGNSEYFGKDSTYTWKAVSLPEGVTLEDNNLVISRLATAGEAKLKVTYNPSFVGADEQTEAQKAARTTEVTINIAVDPNVSHNPVAENIAVSGDIADGEILSVNYFYWQFDGFGDASTITWYKRLPEETSWTPFLTGKKDTASSYTAVKDDEKYYFRVGVKPYTNSDPVLSGEEEFSDEIFKATAPEAKDVKVSGIRAIGEKLTATYTYYDVNKDEEATSTIQWYKASSKDGKYEPIAGETSASYTIKDEDKNMYIKVGVIAVSKVKPYSDAQKEAYSEPALAATGPTATNLAVKKISNTMLSVTYDYIHPLNIAESDSVIEWYMGDSLLSSGSSFNAASYNGRTITVKVTPYAEKEPCEGTTESINYTVSIPVSSGGSSGGGGGGGGFKPSKPVVTPVTPIELKNVPDWAKTEVDFVIANKIMEPFKEGDFGGSEFINRAEFMSVVLTAAGIEKTDYRGEFADVISYDSYSGLLQAAVDKKIISKYDNFYPERNLTRDEMAKIIAATVKAAVGKENPSGSIEHFKDAALFQDWSISYIKEAIGLGLVKGVSVDEFSPKGTVTRSETAVVAKRIADYVKANGGLEK